MRRHVFVAGSALLACCAYTFLERCVFQLLTMASRLDMQWDVEGRQILGSHTSMDMIWLAPGGGRLYQGGHIAASDESAIRSSGIRLVINCTGNLPQAPWLFQSGSPARPYR